MTTTYALDEELDARVPRGFGGAFYGVYCAVVVDITDPEGWERVKVELPWSPDPKDASYRAWARVATLMAGPDRGSWFVPDVDDEVLVAFEGGDARRPYVMGALWNGSDAAPERMDGAGNNDVKSITTRQGVKITLDDASGRERLKLETPGGNTVTLDDSARSITLEDANGNSVELGPAGITLSASGKVTIEASLVEVTAGSVNVNAGLSRFSGVAQADTVLSNSVVSASYTPGAGNIW